MKMALNKKYVIAGAIGLVTITGAIAYWQYKKIMDYAITVKNTIINSITATLIDLTLNLNFENKSNVAFVIESQSYNVYINNGLIAKLTNNKPITIAPKSVSVIPLNVKVSLTKALESVKLNIADILLKPESVILKVVAKLKVKLWFFSVNIPFTYSASIKELRSKKG
jgi:LEA14-like dessication related protein